MGAAAISSDEARRLNRVIDGCLSAWTAAQVDEVLEATRGRDPRAMGERVRRRATVLGRMHRQQRFAILQARDALILALYRQATPSGWYAAWSDGSVRVGHKDDRAGIGGVVLAPEGSVVARVSHSISACDAFTAELAAATAVLQAALGQGAKRLRLHTDCEGFVALWLEQRDDPRLAGLRALAGRCRRFELRRVPRQHNQPAHRLARRGAQESAGEGTVSTKPLPRSRQ